MTTTKLVVEVTAQVHDMLTRLVQRGFHGHSEEEAAERILCQALEERLRDSIVPDDA